jgi:plastocyanin
MRTIIFATLLGAAFGCALAGAVVAAGGDATVPAAAVGIDNFTFAPKELKVQAGTKVTWTNHDDIPHGLASADGSFTKSNALDTDDAYSFTFNTPGTYAYFCYIHPHMTGTIVVEAAAGDNAAH